MALSKGGLGAALSFCSGLFSRHSKGWLKSEGALGWKLCWTWGVFS